MYRKQSACLFFLCFLLLASGARSQSLKFTRTATGILLSTPKGQSAVQTIQVDFITGKIVHVMAFPGPAATAPSLMVVDKRVVPVPFTIKQNGATLLLSTAALTVKASLETGNLVFLNKAGQSLVNEIAGGRTLEQATWQGESSFKTGQIFSSETNEAYYGLGQHQAGMLNYKDQHVDLLQNNTEVAVPFVVSSKNYGILWDNYSITKAGDTRDYLPLSAFRLYAADGTEGWLTATYTEANNPGKKLAVKPESEISYNFLSDMHRFPAEVLMASSKVTWEGELASPYTGTHNLLTKYSGYIKVWIGDKLLLDKWRQSWNPGTENTSLYFEKGKKVPVKIEWIPGSSESFLGFNWLGPVPVNNKNQFAFSSESGGQINYYLVTGKNTDEVISGYRQLTGKATMMPRWAMGFWQSRERYKTQDEVLSTVKEFRDRKIPLDNVVLDWSYWKQDQWGSQEFDETRFADAEGMIRKLHDYNSHFMISVWAKFYEGINAYNLFDKNGWLYKRNVANQQRDWIGKGYVSTFYDPLNPLARAGFWELLNKNLYKKGVDAWWMDASEPDIHSNADITERKNSMNPTFLGSGTQYFNAFPLQNAKGIYEGQRKTNPADRVFILTRSAYAGQQRYAAATWSGDIASRWEDLKAQIPAGINFSLSGIPYWTMDIGGFAVEPRYEKGGDLDEWRELNARWYQFGAFVPIFRVHGQLPFREIYNIAPADHPAYKSMLYYNQLRYRLMPYTYSLVGKTYQDDYTIMRGLIMDFGTDEHVKNIADEYLYGPSLLICPVYEYHATSRNVYLPAGTGWFDFNSGKYFTGGQTIVAQAPYERMPMYVKAGSIIPVGPGIQYTAEKKPNEPLILYVYGGKNASFTLYDDEGTNYKYEQGAFEQIPLTYNEATHSLTIGDRKGSYAGMQLNRSFRVVYVGTSNQKATDFTNPDAGIELKYSGKAITVKL